MSEIISQRKYQILHYTVKYKKTGPKKDREKAYASGVLPRADVIISVGKLKLNYQVTKGPTLSTWIDASPFIKEKDSGLGTDGIRVGHMNYQDWDQATRGSIKVTQRECVELELK